MRVLISREARARDLPIPHYQTAGSSGADLYAAVEEPLTLAPGAHSLVPTGIRVAVPDGYEAQIRPRSGLAASHAVGMVNSPGTIDSDFRGEIHVILVNWGQEPFTIHRGDRIAQMVIVPVERVDWEEVEHLPETERGEGGFGSTGLRGEDHHV